MFSRNQSSESNFNNLNETFTNYNTFSNIREIDNNLFKTNAKINELCQLKDYEGILDFLNKNFKDVKQLFEIYLVFNWKHLYPLSYNEA